MNPAEQMAEAFEKGINWERVDELAQASKLDFLLADEDEEEDELLEAVAAQEAINAGRAWSMEGGVGRYLMGLIDAGHCMVGLEPRYDYYGNLVPARYMLEEGSVGTPGYVRTHKGQEWLDFLLAAEEELEEE